MERYKDIEKSLDACYEAILVPEKWPDALHKLSRALDAACVMFYPRNPDLASNDPRNPSRPLMRMPISHDYRDLLEEYTKNGWFLNHYRAERGLPLLDSGRRVVIEDDISTKEERKHLLHYNELYLNFGFPGFAMIGFSVEGAPWAVPILRGIGQGHFTRKDAKYLSSISSHFRRFIALSERFVLHQNNIKLDILNASCAAFLLDGQGRVAQFNSRAAQLLTAGLSVAHGRLHATDHGSDMELQRVIHIATHARSASGLQGVGPVAVTRPGKRPLLIDVLPTIGIIADAFLSTSTILVVSDLDEKPLPSGQRLRAAFGLSTAEARVAGLLSAGHGLDTIADELRLSRETVRAHLKNIYLKTDTNRQAELVSIMSRIYPKNG